MICTWTVSVPSGFTNFAICGSDDMQCRSTFSTEAHSLILMICTWTVQYHLGLQILIFVEVMICSTEAHSVILLNDLYMDSSVSSGFTNFAFLWK